MKLNPSLPLACLLAGAGLLQAQVGDKKPYDGQSDVGVTHDDAKVMLGTFVGAFGAQKITICLDRVIGKTVTGYSIVAGNERAFSGSWERSVSDFDVTAKEPGDHAADGVFQFKYVTADKALVGEWKPNDKKIGIRKFKLPARKFTYNPKAGKYPQSSTRSLTEKDVENLKNEELRIMRNEIYARHGYSFKLADMREYFDKLDWYMPMAIDITSQLTKVETKNAALIRRYEKYSADYYDSFGR